MNILCSADSDLALPYAFIRMKNAIQASTYMLMGSVEFFMYKKKYGKMYDTFTYFDGSIKGLENVTQNKFLAPAAAGELNHNSIDEVIAENGPCDLGGEGGQGVPTPTVFTGSNMLKYISFNEISKFFKRCFSA